MSQFARLLSIIGREPGEPLCICHKTDAAVAMGYTWTTVAEAPGVAEALSGREHVWFGVQPMARPESGRGKSRDVTAVRTLYADLDYVGPEKPAGMSPQTAMAIVMDLSAAIGADPSAIVRTGHGIQPYWPCEAVDPMLGILLLLRFKALVAHIAAAHSATVDLQVFDLPRILRVPGPPNLKYGTTATTGMTSPFGVGARLRAIDVEAAVTAALPAESEALRLGELRHASGAPRAPGPHDGRDRLFTDAQAKEFLEEFAHKRARETAWGAGADYWKVLWECALVASNFTDMFSEDSLKAALRAAIRSGHDGVEANTADDYQIDKGFLKGQTWRAVRVSEEESLAAQQAYREARVEPGNLDPFSEGFDEAAAMALQAEDHGATDYDLVDASGAVLASSDVPVYDPFAPDHPIRTPRPRPEASLNGQADVPPTGRRLKVLRASEIKMESCDWLWEHGGEFWIPLGGLVLLGGREGVGKSTWTARLVAQITNGTMEGEFAGKPRSVIVSATEDAWPQTIIPRLVAAGADLSRVLRVDAVVDETATGLSLPHDVAALHKLMADEDVVMVVLDPLLSTIAVGLDTHKDSDVRKALEPICLLAAESRATFLGLIHQNKTQGGDLLTRLMGSRAFAAVARAVLACAETEVEEPEETEPAVPKGPRSFLFGQLKNNLGPRVETSVRYEIISAIAGHDVDTGKPVRTSKVDVKDYAHTEGVEDAVFAHEKAMRETGDKRRKPDGTQVDKCRAWVVATLQAHGRMETRRVREGAVAAGFSEAAFKKAMAGLDLDKGGDYHNPTVNMPCDTWSPSRHAE